MLLPKLLKSILHIFLDDSWKYLKQEVPTPKRLRLLTTHITWHIRFFVPFEKTMRCRASRDVSCVVSLSFQCDHHSVSKIWTDAKGLIISAIMNDADGQKHEKLISLIARVLRSNGIILTALGAHIRQNGIKWKTMEGLSILLDL